MIKGILFDLDGVLLSTEQFHFQAWKALADRLGIPFDQAQGDRCRGVSRMDSLDIVLEGSPRSYTPEEKLCLAEEKNNTYRSMLARLTPADLSEETVRVLTTLRQRGYRLGLASASKNAPLILEKTGLGKLLDGGADGNTVTHSKPHPEVFFKAAESLGLDPGDCMGVDDAVAGVQAIHAAGMPAAAMGPAAQAGLGDWNLETLSQLLEQCPPLEEANQL
ncbi:beta-phosphoglucomutase [Pseudoflavonifractor sp. AF19-9AC]|uniref:beta-phosphoglucomutase n=1 Tax=Pseudoflavonifractor sp. AF19-9AC TaxID=2292244 RepID=UPI000E54B3F0|nr:beta-phosphoglucomutase [Pseudoflavonifractor sp. AF19-9AC]RHR08080.1 beta-phosphoglucomutase [Pseudoflavonifractor sp. AF19-9AC]